MNAELDKIDETGTIKWLSKAELGILPKEVKFIPLTMTFNYKRNKMGEVEERKSHASLRGDLMKAHIHFDPAQTSAPMVDRVAVRLILAQSVDHGWTLEHFDIESDFLHERYKYHQPVYIREMARADGTYNREEQ